MNISWIFSLVEFKHDNKILEIFDFPLNSIWLTERSFKCWNFSNEMLLVPLVNSTKCSFNCELNDTFLIIVVNDTPVDKDNKFIHNGNCLVLSLFQIDVKTCMDANIDQVQTFKSVVINNTIPNKLIKSDPYLNCGTNVPITIANANIVIIDHFSEAWFIEFEDSISEGIDDKMENWRIDEMVGSNKSKDKISQKEFTNHNKQVSIIEDVIKSLNWSKVWENVAINDKAEMRIVKKKNCK